MNPKSNSTGPGGQPALALCLEAAVLSTLSPVAAGHAGHFPLGPGPGDSSGLGLDLSVLGAFFLRTLTPIPLLTQGMVLTFSLRRRSQAEALSL